MELQVQDDPGDMDPGQGRKTTHFFSSQYLELIHIASMN
jgi:hypothetical protein